MNVLHHHVLELFPPVLSSCEDARVTRETRVSGAQIGWEWHEGRAKGEPRIFASVPRKSSFAPLWNRLGQAIPPSFKIRFRKVIFDQKKILNSFNGSEQN